MSFKFIMKVNTHFKAEIVELTQLFSESAGCHCWISPEDRLVCN